MKSDQSKIISNDLSFDKLISCVIARKMRSSWEWSSEKQHDNPNMYLPSAILQNQEHLLLFSVARNQRIDDLHAEICFEVCTLLATLNGMRVIFAAFISWCIPPFESKDYTVHYSDNMEHMLYSYATSNWKWSSRWAWWAGQTKKGDFLWRTQSEELCPFEEQVSGC